MKIVIATPAILAGDAIGHDVIGQYECLKEAGLDACIFTGNHMPGGAYLKEDEFRGVLKEKSALLIYHHSIQWAKGVEMFKDAQCKKVIKYHNMTPEHFFLPYSMDYFRACLMGRKEIQELLNADMFIADSYFNTMDLLRGGCPGDRMRVLAPFHKIHDFDRIEEDKEISRRLRDGRINVLFVGRGAPNKGHMHLIHTAFYFRFMFGNNIRFYFVGRLDPALARYYDELGRLIDFLQVGNIVSFVGAVPFPALKSYYTGSHCFLLLSQHEGFCVPILESQYFKLPIIAYGSSAVCETMGDNQLVFDEIDYELLAASIHTLVNEGDLSTYLTGHGYRNFLKYEGTVLKEKLLSYIGELN